MQHNKLLVACVLVGALYWCAQLPVLSAGERADLARRFRFEGQTLLEISRDPQRFVRAVHPSLEHISAWISSVGASVALADLDGDGLPNDVCHVDTRVDEVTVGPAPGTPQQYPMFVLDARPLPYDPKTMAPMGCVPGDLNEDGLIDVLAYYWGRTPIAFLRQPRRANSPIAFVPREIKEPLERWYTNAVTLADVDGDGHADVVVGNYFQDGARILDAIAQGSEAMQASMSRARNSGRHHVLLFRGGTGGGQPTVQFEELAMGGGDEIAYGWTLAVGAQDLDGDLLPELYFANDFGPDQLLHNQSRPGALRFAPLYGHKSLTTPSSKVLGRDSFKGMGVDFGDVNDDGWPDIYVSNIAGQYALEESHFLFVSTGETHRMRERIAPYVDRSETLGVSRSDWAWDVKLADFDNDGVLEALQATGFVKGVVNRWPELHELAMGNDQLLSHPRSWPRFQPGDDLSGHQHNPFFVRAHDGRYHDLAGDLGLDDQAVSRGIATADINGDGLLDFAVANQWESSRLYMNTAGVKPFLGLHLLLRLAQSPVSHTSVRQGHPGTDTPGTPAIGAVVSVSLPNGRRLAAQVDGGNGHSGRRSPDLHFGLSGVSPETTTLRVEVRWRDRQGRTRRETLQLAPGWHTVLLGI